MGDREKASLRLQFNPQIRLELPGWSYMVPPSPPTPDCWHSENWMTPWTLPILLPTISRKAVPAATSATTWSLCSASPSTAAWLATMTPTMPNVFPKTQP